MSKKQRQTPVLIVGLDGGSWTILRPAVEEGYMPFLKKMMDAGSWGVLESTIPAITPAAWSAFQTGRNPGSTGIFEFLWWNRQTKKYGYANSNYLDRTIWEIFSDHGKRVAALNVPMTYPPKKVNGIIVSGLMTPSMKHEFTYPPDFKNELFEHVPQYDIFNTFRNIPRKPISRTREKKFIDDLIQMIQSRTDAACFLMHKQLWDLFMIHFQATDVLQHQLWKYLDRSHPEYTQKKRDWLLTSFFQKLDIRIERVYHSFKEVWGQEPLLVVMSDHGFESHYRRFNLFNWLCEKGFLCIDPEAIKEPFVKEIIRKSIPKLRKYFSGPLLNKILSRVHLDTIPVIWEKTQAFTCGVSNGEGAIYLLADDETEREQLLQKISNELLSIKDPVNGKSVVRKIHRKEMIYSGNRMNQLPDLILEPEPTYSFTVQYQPEKELFTNVKEDRIIHIGKHHKDGILVVAGPHIRKKEGVRFQITDVLPTILCYNKIPVPENLDGKVCFELFEDSFCQKFSHKEQLKPYTASSEQITLGYKGQVYTSDDEKALKQRLKDLGYID